MRAMNKISRSVVIHDFGIYPPITMHCKVDALSDQFAKQEALAYICMDVVLQTRISALTSFYSVRGYHPNQFWCSTTKTSHVISDIVFKI